jgi:hypothetical protein
LKVQCTAHRDFQLAWLTCLSAGLTKRIRAQFPNGDLLERAVQVDRAFDEAPRAGVMSKCEIGTPVECATEVFGTSMPASLASRGSF